MASAGSGMLFVSAVATTTTYTVPSGNVFVGQMYYGASQSATISIGGVAITTPTGGDNRWVDLVVGSGQTISISITAGSLT